MHRSFRETCFLLVRYKKKRQRQQASSERRG